MNQNEFNQIEIFNHKTNHILHLLLSVLTAGFWIGIWAIVSCVNCSKRNDIRKTTGLKPETNYAGVVLVGVFLMFAWLLTLVGGM